MDPLSNWFRSLLLPSASHPRATTKTASSLHSQRVCVPLRLPDASSSPNLLTHVDLGGGSSSEPEALRVSTLDPGDGSGGGPAFVGQVFTMCDLTGSGLMAVSTDSGIPFLSQRTPDWLKRIFSSVVKSERNEPVFRFFLDVGDALTYVKRLDIPTGAVGACPLDLAYAHFKEKPHLFQFVPNEQQVKAANRLLKTIPQGDRRKKIDGVPVFSAQNLDIAIANSDGIKYTPYFFDKDMLDDIIEESVDEHFRSLIHNRHNQRLTDVIDADVMEEMGDTLMEPPEVEELMDEIGPEIPLSVISKAAEMYLRLAVDNVTLGNRWFRKATGIQPKYPYVVDSFERRTASSSHRNADLARSLPNSEKDSSASGLELRDDDEQRTDLRLPFGHWFPNPWLEQRKAESDTRSQDSSKKYLNPKLDPNPFLPKITMVGISASKAGDQSSEGRLRETLDDLTRELEQADYINSPDAAESNESKVEERDPLFVADMGDRYTALSIPGPGKSSSPRLIHGGKK